MQAKTPYGMATPQVTTAVLPVAGKAAGKTGRAGDPGGTKHRQDSGSVGRLLRESRFVETVARAATGFLADVAVPAGAIRNRG
jgi:hypothetical protein